MKKTLLSVSPLMLLVPAIGCQVGSDSPRTSTSAISQHAGLPIVRPPRSNADGPPSPTDNPVQVAGSCPVDQTVSYSGGPVLQNVVIVNLYWGSSAQAGNRSFLDGFASAITSSSFMDYMGEYSTGSYVIGRGTFGGDYEMTPPAGTEAGTVTDTQVTTELFAEINAGTLPANDANHLYFIYFPPGLTISSSVAGLSCSSYYGYHYFGSNNGQNVVYSVMPDLGPQGCNATWIGMTVNDLTTLVASHELAEATADPIWPSGWGEVGDPCAWAAPPATVNGYTVQRCWSNAANGCVAAPPPNPLATCGSVCSDTSSDPANCGGCGNACSNGGSCVSGQCTGGGCQGGQILCAGACTDPTSDPNNCGACGNACPDGDGCISSQCVPASCQDGQILCAGACTDPTSDPNNCGACGNVCSSGFCSEGTCF
jgi:hypothetical protein